MSAWMKPSNNRSSAPQELKLALSIENVAWRYLGEVAGFAEVFAAAGSAFAGAAGPAGVLFTAAGDAAVVGGVMPSG